jgi:glyoxylate reductase
VLCTLLDTIDAEVMDAAGPGCRIFANYAVGYNNIDIEGATARGILVTNTPDVLTNATADLTWALILAAARRIVESDEVLRSGRWDGWGPMQLLGYDVAGRTIGIVGAGRIGTAVARRATGFSMRILYTDPQPHGDIEALGGQRVDLARLLSESDIVTTHVPLTQATRHLIGAEELAKMKPTSVLVNTSRGPVIDEAALVGSLRGGRIGAAGLDVYEDEPRPAPGLVECRNAVLLPHIGSATHQARAKMATMAAGNILAALAGQRPGNLVNPKAWRKMP